MHSPHMFMYFANRDGRRQILILAGESERIVVATIEYNASATWTLTTDAHLPDGRRRRSQWKTLYAAIQRAERWSIKYRDRHLKGC